MCPHPPLEAASNTRQLPGPEPSARPADRAQRDKARGRTMPAPARPATFIRTWTYRATSV